MYNSALNHMTCDTVDLTGNEAQQDPQQQNDMLATSDMDIDDSSSQSSLPFNPTTRNKRGQILFTQQSDLNQPSSIQLTQTRSTTPFNVELESLSPRYEWGSLFATQSQPRVSPVKRTLSSTSQSFQLNSEHHQTTTKANGTRSSPRSSSSSPTTTSSLTFTPRQKPILKKSRQTSPRRISPSLSLYPTPCVSPRLSNKTLDPSTSLSTTTTTTTSSRVRLGPFNCRKPPTPPPLASIELPLSLLISLDVSTPIVDSALRTTTTTDQNDEPDDHEGSTRQRSISPELFEGVNVGFKSNDQRKQRLRQDREQTIVQKVDQNLLEKQKQRMIQMIKRNDSSSSLLRLRPVMFPTNSRDDHDQIQSINRPLEFQKQDQQQDETFDHGLTLEERLEIQNYWSKTVELEESLTDRLHLSLDEFKDDSQQSLRNVDELLSSAQVREPNLIEQRRLDGYGPFEFPHEQESTSPKQQTKTKSIVVCDYDTIGLSCWTFVSNNENVIKKGLTMLPPKDFQRFMSQKLMKEIEKIDQDETMFEFQSLVKELSTAMN
ncbi:hypothetical protein OIO90_004441 [Microbotryomycetes sp. JL221]|nr:hypothetical protein OIO90_004441 [Microbotryomycetes sp. JL221]